MNHNMPVNERVRPRLPEPAQVYHLGHYEQMVIAKALQEVLVATKEANPEGHDRVTIDQMLNIFGTAGTVTLIKHGDQ